MMGGSTPTIIFQIDRAFSIAANQQHPALAANSVPEPAAIGIGLLISTILSIRMRRVVL